MKKHEFYSMVQVNDEAQVIKQKGYTDGKYNYYKSDSKLWFCIDPKSGVAVANGYTRQEAQQKAQSVADQVERVKQSLKYKGWVEQFAELRQEAKITYI